MFYRIIFYLKCNKKIIHIIINYKNISRTAFECFKINLTNILRHNIDLSNIILSNLINRDIIFGGIAGIRMRRFGSGGRPKTARILVHPVRLRRPREDNKRRHSRPGYYHLRYPGRFYSGTSVRQ